jgi:hypothetical protein
MDLDFLGFSLGHVVSLLTLLLTITAEAVTRWMIAAPLRRRGKCFLAIVAWSEETRSDRVPVLGHELTALMGATGCCH